MLIPVSEFCESHKVEIEIVQRLNDYGLIEIVSRQDTFFIPDHQVKRLEKTLVFYRDLDINLEGIDAIFNLLEQMESMQNRIIELENKLQRFL